MGLKHATFKSEQNVPVYIINDTFNVVLLWWLGVPIMNCVLLVSLKAVFFVIVFCFLRCHGAMFMKRKADLTVLNDRPIIGILSQEQHYKLKDVYAREDYTSYIAASYVKSVEECGARVVPIMIGKNRDYYRELMSKINGVVFPGGATYFNQSNGYADAGQHIYEIAMEMNDDGDYFPIFGTCLGFELLIILASGRGEPENREDCKAFGNVPIKFTEDFRDGKMFKDIDDQTVDWFEHESIAINAHHYCILDENLKRHGLTADWRVTSHSLDDNGLEYIASVENKRYPFYGTQFHPEKAPYEWSPSQYYTHTPHAIKANRYFMDFFVQECRKNRHSFENQTEENGSLIYNYKPFFTGKNISAPFIQCYFFEPRNVISKL